MAELRPYEPTWRDRLANVLMGDGSSSARQQFVEGLLGSRGLGQTGMGLVDVTPFGVPLAVQESRQAFEQGSPVTGLLGAMAVLPAARPAALAAKAATQEAAQGIRAYHGSPHDFDRFDLSKIGTGEGAQSYGHGLYFAEAEPVAKEYRDALAAAANKRRAVDDDFYNQVLALQGRAPEPPSSPIKGKMYEVNINAKPEQFLDWNKQVAEQKEFLDLIHPDPNVQRAVLEKVLGGQKGSGEDYYKALGGDRKAQNIAQSLSKSGVPGIKYLDQGSRASGEGSRNYVVFDDKLIDIMRKYGLAGLLGGGTAAGALSQQEDMSQ